jgi:hypothetical protein
MPEAALAALPVTKLKYEALVCRFGGNLKGLRILMDVSKDLLTKINSED